MTAEFPAAYLVERYLERSGWESEKAPPHTSVWIKANPELEILQVVIPDGEHGELDEEAIGEALRTIAFSERRTVDDVRNDILLQGADAMALRYTPDLPSGQVFLPQVEAALASLRALVVASAAALTISDAVLPKRKPSFAERLGHQVRIGFDQGSFVIRATIPLKPTAEYPAQTDEDLFEGVAASQTRKVTNRIIDALNFAQKSARRAAESGKYEQFLGGGNSPINVGELEAFAGLGGPGNEPYQIRFSLSPMDSDISDNRRQVRVSHLEQEIFVAAADYLKKNQEEVVSQISGRIVRLARSAKVGPGKITVRSVVDATGVERSVQVELTEEDYGVALRAHESAALVMIRGRLRHEASGWKLHEPSDFEVLAESDGKPQ